MGSFIKRRQQGILNNCCMEDESKGAETRERRSSPSRQCVREMREGYVICSTEGIVIHRTDARKSPRIEGTAEHIRDVPCDRARDMLSHVRADTLDTTCLRVPIHGYHV